jgi:hypothetical protein
MDNYLLQGIAAAKAGDQARAFQLLSQASQDSATAEQAWLWLSGVVSRDEERLFCLGNVLRINPNNQHAKPAAAMLRQKGIFPSPPTPPSVVQPPPAPAISKPAFEPQSSPGPVLSPQPVKMDVQPVEAKPTKLDPGANKIQEEMAAYMKYAALELSNNKLPPIIVKELTDRGLQPEVASRIVTETQRLLKRARGEKYKKRMTRGLLWTVAGLVLTCGSYAFADQLGGSYVLCWGAIIFGIIDLLVGLIGWLSSQ